MLSERRQSLGQQMLERWAKIGCTPLLQQLGLVSSQHLAQFQEEYSLLLCLILLLRHQQ